MFPISSSSSSIYSLSPEPSYSISFFSSFIVSIVLHSLVLPPFHCLQFLSNLVQYSLSYLLFNYPNNFFVMNYSGNSSLLNVPSSFSYFLTSSISCQYSFSYSSIAFLAFFRFSLPSQVSDSAVNPFYHTRYLSFSRILYLFRILFTFHFSSPLITTGAGCSFLCPSTCPTYLCILLTLTTECIFTVLDSSNSTAFNDIICFIL